MGQDDPGSGWTYLKKEDLDIARELAQRSYDECAVSRIALELEAIDDFLRDCPGKNLIVTFETDDVPLNVAAVEESIRQYLL